MATEKYIYIFISIILYQTDGKGVKLVVWTQI